MKWLRKIHIFIGVIFAPLFFVILFTGILQVIGFQNKNSFLSTISTLHTQLRLKEGFSLSSSFGYFILIGMAICLFINVALGLIMAKKVLQPKLFWGSIVIGVALLILTITIPFIK